MGFVPRLPHPSIFLFLTELYIPSSSTDPMTFRPPFHTFLQAPLPLGRFLTSFLWNSCCGMKAEIPGDQLTRGRMENSWNEFLADQAPNAPHLWKKFKIISVFVKLEAELSVLLTGENKMLNSHINYMSFKDAFTFHTAFRQDLSSESGFGISLPSATKPQRLRKLSHCIFLEVWHVWVLQAWFSLPVLREDLYLQIKSNIDEDILPLSNKQYLTSYDVFNICFSSRMLMATREKLWTMTCWVFWSFGRLKITIYLLIYA